MTDRIRRIAILGNGFEGALAAAGLARHIGGGGIEIVLCPVEGADRWDGLYSLLPAGPDDLVRSLGIDDIELVHSCDGNFSLGANISVRCEQPAGQLKAFGPSGIDFAGVGFHHYWQRCRDDKRLSDYFGYSPGNRAMAEGRYAPPVSRNTIGPLQHEYARIANPWALAGLLRANARTRGVRELDEPIEQLVWSGDRAAALNREGEPAVSADLYIDCSGPANIASMRQYWLDAPLGIDYDIELGSTETDATRGAWYDVVGNETGWRITLPGGNETLSVHLRPTDDAVVAYRAGCLRAPWIGNVVALGHAAHVLLPIEPLQTTALMQGIRRVIDLLPGRDCASIETREYNQLFSRDIGDALQLIALHELARTSDDIHQALASAGEEFSVLAEQVRLFEACGRLPATDSSLVEPHQWINALLFYGFEPTRYDAIALRLEEDDLRQKLAQLAARISDVVGEFPTHRQYLDAVRDVARERS